MRNANKHLSGAKITIAGKFGSQAEILLYPPSLLHVELLKFHVQRIRDRGIDCNYPQYDIEKVTIVEFYQALDPELREKWPFLMVPKDPQEMMSAFLKRAFADIIADIAKMLHTSLGCTLDDEQISLSDTELCRIFIGDKPTKKLLLDGEEKLIPGLSLCEKFVGYSIPDEEVEATPTESTPDLKDIHVELIAQLCNAFEGTAPADWFGLPIDYTNDFLDVCQRIRKAQKEAMERERDGESKGVPFTAIQTSYAEIDQESNQLASSNGSDPEATFEFDIEGMPDE